MHVGIEIVVFKLSFLHMDYVLLKLNSHFGYPIIKLQNVFGIVMKPLIADIHGLYHKLIIHIIYFSRQVF